MPMTSRERMLAALSCKKPDYVPLSFMIFNLLHSRSGGWQHVCERSLAMGIEPVVSLFGCARGNGTEH